MPLKITIPENELFNPKTNEFYKTDKTELVLEHSLVSISKWECSHERSFFSKEPMTSEMLVDYVRCMTLNKNIDPMVYASMTKDNVRDITDYMQKPMTARKKFKTNKNKEKSFVTSEDFYYNMIMYGIPLECEKWHINRLLALIDYCNVHNPDGRKMDKKSQRNMYSELNAARRKAWNSKG